MRIRHGRPIIDSHASLGVVRHVVAPTPNKKGRPGGDTFCIQRYNFKVVCRSLNPRSGGGVLAVAVHFSLWKPESFKYNMLMAQLRCARQNEVPELHPAPAESMLVRGHQVCAVVRRQAPAAIVRRSPFNAIMAASWTRQYRKVDKANRAGAVKWEIVPQTWKADRILVESG